MLSESETNLNLHTNMQSYIFFVLVFSFVISISKKVEGELNITDVHVPNAEDPNEEDDTPCKLGQSCTEISECETFVEILKQKSPASNRRIREEFCGVTITDDGATKTKVCCPNKTVVPPQPATPPIPTKPVSDVSVVLSTEEQRDNIDSHKNLKLLPPLSKCGVSLTSDRIVGGKIAGLGAYPWLVLLGVTGPDKEIQWHCGASLISERVALTAAHCTAKLPKGFKITHVRIGEYNQDTDPDCDDKGLCAPKIQQIAVERVINHASYDKRRTTENDIALVIFQKPCQFNAFVQPVCLPRGSVVKSIPSNAVFSVAGWGRTHYEMEEGSKILKEVSVPLISHAKCEESYQRQANYTEHKITSIDDTRYCAGGESGEDSCRGDSGGPLLSSVPVPELKGKQVITFQWGIVSKGPTACGLISEPALYTKIVTFMPWILDNLPTEENTVPNAKPSANATMAKPIILINSNTPAKLNANGSTAGNPKNGNTNAHLKPNVSTTAPAKSEPIAKTTAKPKESTNAPVKRYECVTPQGEFGYCIELEECEPLFEVLKSRVYDKTFLENLQKSTCGWAGNTPKVCCSSESSVKDIPPHSEEISQLENLDTETENHNGVDDTDSLDTSDPAVDDDPVEDNEISPVVASTAILQEIASHPNLHLLPTPKTCGNSFGSDRIVGGKDAGLGTYPWMALLGYEDGPKVQYFCGGTLINRRYVLTAAHCTAKLPNGLKLKSVRIGEYDKSRNPDCQGELCAPPVQDFVIENVIAHEEYDKELKNENDIALIRLRKPVRMGPFTQPICLPLTEYVDAVPSPIVYNIAGWGKIDFRSPVNTQVLQEVAIPLISLKECEKYYRNAFKGHMNKLESTRFCAGGEAGKDSCKGDSGGPLMSSLPSKVVFRNQSRTFQLGIVSLGPSQCGKANQPALYTKITENIPWILQNIKP